MNDKEILESRKEYLKDQKNFRNYVVRLLAPVVYPGYQILPKEMENKIKGWG